MGVVNVAHAHLLLNHVPTIGTVIGLGMFCLALFRRSDQLRHASLEVFFLSALLTLPTYVSGVAAQTSIQGLPDVSEASIQAHHDAALLAFVLMQLTGAAAWLALWQVRRTLRPAFLTSSAVVLFSVLTVASMARAATVGGEIRHPEILSETAAVEQLVTVRTTGWLTSGSIETFVNEYRWAWPVAEIFHFVGLSLALGVLLILNLRLLGAMKRVPFAALHGLLPWGMLGLGINLVTGMLFFIAASSQYIQNVPFYFKIGFLVIAGANFLYLTVFDRTWALEPGDDTRLAEKVVAALAIVLWVGIIYWGRMLPFIGNAF